MTTFDDVKTWIITKASADDMETLREAMDTRTDLLADEIRKGDKVKIHNISPKYLEGLSGTFYGRSKGRGKSRGSVLLDEASTRILRTKGKERVFISPGDKEYTLGGIPMTCLIKVS